MSRKCVLCHDENITYHSFPKTNDMLLKWVSVCGLDINQIDPAVSKLCSKHFTSNSFYYTQKAKCIKSNAVPIISENDKNVRSTTNKINSDHNETIISSRTAGRECKVVSTDDKSTYCDLTSSSTMTNQDDCFCNKESEIVSLNVEKNKTNIQHTTISNIENSDVVISNNNSTNCEEISQKDIFCQLNDNKKYHLLTSLQTDNNIQYKTAQDIEENTDENDSESMSSNSDDEFYQGKKKIWSAAYTAQLNAEHFKSPKMIERSLDVIKKEMTKLRKKNKLLYTRNHRLIKRLSNYKKLLKMN